MVYTRVQLVVARVDTDVFEHSSSGVFVAARAQPAKAIPLYVVLALGGKIMLDNRATSCSAHRIFVVIRKARHLSCADLLDFCNVWICSEFGCCVFETLHVRLCLLVRSGLLGICIFYFGV